MKKMTKGLILGTTLGLTLGILLAPDRGDVTRKKVKIKISSLMDYIKNIDSVTLRRDCLGKLNNIKKYLEELDNAKLKKDVLALKMRIKKEMNALCDLVSSVSSPYVNKAVREFRNVTLAFLYTVVKRLEN